MEYSVYIKHKALCFIIQEQKIYFRTKLQTNYLKSTASHNAMYLVYLRQKILSLQIHTLEELAYSCRDKVAWIPTEKRFYKISINDYNSIAGKENKNEENTNYTNLVCQCCNDFRFASRRSDKVIP